MTWIYLDNNATTQPAPEVADAMHEANQHLWANPSSVHRFGQTVRQRLELARQSLARLINAKPREMVFTSGGTESNNLALRGLLDAALRRAADDQPAPVLITTALEHSAIREPAEDFEKAGGLVHHLPTSPTGVAEPEGLADALARYTDQPRLILVSVQWANNETGVIQPIPELAPRIQQARDNAAQHNVRARIHFHVDATQAVGKIPVDVKAVGIDLLSLAGHKFHGPKGAGALYIRTGVRLRPQQRGGPQEHEKRGGTENTVAILGLGVAADLARDFLNDPSRPQQLQALRDQFENAILQTVPHALVNARDPQTPRLWNTSNLAFPGLEAEAILLGLSERNLCASAGAACSSGSLEPSPVLLAMGLPEPVAHGSVRFSLGRYTTPDDIQQAIQIVPEVVNRLGKTMPLAV